MTRPAFLEQNHTNGQTIIKDFRKLPLSEAEQVDRWLMSDGYYGSMTWQEECLLRWIDDRDDFRDEMTAAA